MPPAPTSTLRLRELSRTAGRAAGELASQLERSQFVQSQGRSSSFQNFAGDVIRVVTPFAQGYAQHGARATSAQQLLFNILITQLSYLGLRVEVNGNVGQVVVIPGATGAFVARRSTVNAIKEGLRGAERLVSAALASTPVSGLGALGELPGAGGGLGLLLLAGVGVFVIHRVLLAKKGVDTPRHHSTDTTHWHDSMSSY